MKSARRLLSYLTAVCIQLSLDHLPHWPTSDPDMTMFEINNAHWYKHAPTEKWCSSVTAYTKLMYKGDALLAWYAKMGSVERAKAEMRDAGLRGSNVHSGLEDLVKLRTLRRSEFLPDEWEHVQGVVAFVRDNVDRIGAFYGSEQVVYDLDRELAGTYDLTLDFDGKKTLLDLKTSKAIYSEFRVQVNEYAWMANQMGQGIEQTAVLCTKPKTKLGYQLKVYEISEEVHEVFEGLMKQHQLLNKRYGPKLHEQPPEELTIADLFEAS